MKDFGLNAEEQRSLACILFTNHWLNRGALNLLNIPDMGQWIMEEGPKALRELGLIVRKAVEDYKVALPFAVRDRVTGYVRS